MKKPVLSCSTRGLSGVTRNTPLPRSLSADRYNSLVQHGQGTDLNDDIFKTSNLNWGTQRLEENRLA